MKYIKLCCLLFLCLLTVAPLSAQNSGLVRSGATGGTTYLDLPLGELNLAQRQWQSGQMERALITYTGALAWQANWVPPLIQRANLLMKMGRKAEAQKDIMQANRINPRATEFFLAEGKGNVAPYLALYPGEYFRQTYAVTDAEPSPRDATSVSDFRTAQHRTIAGNDSVSTAVQAVRHKLDQDLSASERKIDDLPRDYPQAVRAMLLGNLEFMGRNYNDAIVLYSAALAVNVEKWPELYYNRGLAHILMNDYVSGCQDLKEAERSDELQLAKTMYDCLCNL
ncbi:tetratricopeptide repeat protein [Neolewinella antarctica]|uniref:Tetratricopeptide (TPR) repeat protein n=1 Tax=Neolewinella antarctica TaxID=442734 RepID=A0ABX0XAC7_9BACT|nr:hypothetical protein [Neolewinella antarctica]NJC26229.1 tetratricopeptide (TPR) repeat protein [Neolewinella antarctica]